MIITTAHHNKLFIRFDKIVNKAIVNIHDETGQNINFEILNTEFESIDLQDIAKLFSLVITTESERLQKTINLK